MKARNRRHGLGFTARDLSCISGGVQAGQTYNEVPRFHGSSSGGPSAVVWNGGPLTFSGRLRAGVLTPPAPARTIPIHEWYFAGDSE